MIFFYIGGIALGLAAISGVLYAIIMTIRMIIRNDRRLQAIIVLYLMIALSSLSVGIIINGLW